MKKIFYVFCTTVLGILIATIALCLVERVYIAQLISSNQTYQTSSDIFGFSFLLPFVVIYIFLVVGAVGGVMVGFKWWQYVYIEKKWGKIKNNKTTGIAKSVKKHKLTKQATIKSTKNHRVTKSSQKIKKETIVRKAKKASRAKVSKK